MKSLFPGHFPLTRAELKSIWDSALIVFDANILLGLYRYSDETRTQFFQILERAKQRCWLPNRAVSEFFTNRLNVIQSQESAYDETLKSLAEIESTLKSTNKHPFVTAKLMKKLSDVLEETKSELSRGKQTHSGRLAKDEILHRLEDLFEGRVGPHPTEEELDLMCKEGEKRYKRKVPPGYKDASKVDEVDPTRPYGDLILWKQILEKAAKEKAPVIFVCDDRKEDWWLQAKGKTIGPRPELVTEFRGQTGMLFHMYTADTFLEHAGDHFDSPVSSNSVTEMRELRIEPITTANVNSKFLAAARRRQAANRLRHELASVLLGLSDSDRAKVINALGEFSADQSYALRHLLSNPADVSHYLHDAKYWLPSAGNPQADELSELKQLVQSIKNWLQNRSEVTKE